MGIFKRITPTDVLTLIKTVDGSGSGLDSDLLRGNTPAQVVDNNLGNELTGFKNLGDTAGFLKKTGDGVYSIDTASYLPLTGGTLSAPLALAEGTSTAPSLCFVGDDNTGIYSGGNNIFIFSAGGSNTLTITNAKAQVNSSRYFEISGTSEITSFDGNTGAFRCSGGGVFLKDLWCNNFKTNAATASTSTTTGSIVTNSLGVSSNIYFGGVLNGTKIGRGVDATSLKVGDSAANANTAGQYWTSLGHWSGYAATGNNWTTAGAFAAASATTGEAFTAVGMGAGYSITTSSNWTAVGLFSGRYRSDGVTALTVSANSVYIGANTKGTQSSTNENVFGYNATGNGSNTVTIGDTNITDSYIRGKLRIPDTTASTSSTTGSGIFGGGVGIAGNLNVGGFSSFGGSSGGHPALKFKLIEGTTEASQGLTVAVAHGISGSIKSCSVLVQSGTTNVLLPENHTASAGYEFQWTLDATNIYIALSASNSSNILLKPFQALISYTA